MLIFLELTDESYDRLKKGKRVVGEIRSDDNGRSFVLKPFGRESKRIRKKSKLLCQLPNGKFTESETLYKMYMAVNKLMDIDTIDQVFDSNVQRAMTQLRLKTVINFE